jgi:hypothetical protein
MHAKVLKQIWLHEKPDTIVEDKSCINPITHRPLPTDIVNHNDKIAIEVQSWFHEKKEQKNKDKIKRDFWVQKEYKFYALDIREYSVIKMIQIFFPYISNLPEYLDLEYSNSINDYKLQMLLDQKLPISAIVKSMNVNKHQIYDAIGCGRVKYPENYPFENIRPVIQLSLDNEFICEYESIAQASRSTGILHGNLVSCLCDNRHYCGGYLWYYKSDNFNLNEESSYFKISKFLVPVDKYNIKGDYICSYKSIIEAAKGQIFSNSDIYRVVIGDRKSCKGFIWKKSEHIA